MSNPEDLELALIDFSDFVAERVRQRIETTQALMKIPSLPCLDWHRCSVSHESLNSSRRSIPRYLAVCLRSFQGKGTAPIGDC